MEEQDRFERREEARDGHLAGLLTRNPVFRRTMHEYRQEIFDKWVETEPGLHGRETREELHMMFRIAEELEGRFDELIETGHMAAQQLEDADNERSNERTTATGPSPGRARFTPEFRPGLQSDAATAAAEFGGPDG